MKRQFAALAITLGWALAAWAAEPGTLSTLRSIAALTNAEASQQLPVAFEATVTYFPGYEGLLFVQDGNAAIFVLATTNARLVRGDRVLVKGKTRDSFRTIVNGKGLCRSNSCTLRKL